MVNSKSVCIERYNIKLEKSLPLRSFIAGGGSQIESQLLAPK